MGRNKSLTAIIAILVLFLFGSLGVYSVVTDIDLIKRMDRNSIVFFSIFLLGTIVYGFVLYFISNRMNRIMSPNVFNAWVTVSRAIKVIFIASMAYLVFFFCFLRFRNGSSCNWFVNYIWRHMNLFFPLFLIALVLVVSGCFAFGIIGALFEPLNQDVSDDQDAKDSYRDFRA